MNVDPDAALNAYFMSRYAKLCGEGPVIPIRDSACKVQGKDREYCR